jgi:8-oxo-dGTP pyrophosphatase MutT (NUDIX family)
MKILDYQKLVDFFEQKMKEPLPGKSAHQIMEPPHRNKEVEKNPDFDNYRKSAVLIILWIDQGCLMTTFILRPEYDGFHSNQIAFPGGKREKSDQSFIHTALREANEEVGINSETVKVVGTLTPLFIPPSRFMVYPVIGITKNKPDFKTDPHEVETLLVADISTFLNTENIIKQQFKIRNSIINDIPCYKMGNYLIWGATAMILSELLELIKPFLSIE